MYPNKDVAAPTAGSNQDAAAPTASPGPSSQAAPASVSGPSSAVARGPSSFDARDLPNTATPRPWSVATADLPSAAVEGPSSWANPATTPGPSSAPSRGLPYAAVSRPPSRAHSAAPRGPPSAASVSGSWPVAARRSSHAPRRGPSSAATPGPLPAAVPGSSSGATGALPPPATPGPWPRATPAAAPGPLPAAAPGPSFEAPPGASATNTALVQPGPYVIGPGPFPVTVEYAYEGVFFSEHAPAPDPNATPDTPRCTPHLCAVAPAVDMAARYPRQRYVLVHDTAVTLGPLTFSPYATAVLGVFEGVNEARASAMSYLEKITREYEIRVNYSYYVFLGLSNKGVPHEGMPSVFYNRFWEDGSPPCRLAIVPVEPSYRMGFPCAPIHGCSCRWCFHQRGRVHWYDRPE